MSGLISFVIGLVIGAVGGLVVAYLVYRNNKKKIDELVKVANDLGAVL